MNERNTFESSVSLGHFGVLEGHQYASLSTFRKDGTAVATPVWFAANGGKLYVTTVDGTGKVKRIRNNSSVTLAPCDRRGRLLGEAVEGRARLISTRATQENRYADRALAGKYGLQYRAFGALRNVVAKKRERVFIEISPPDAPGDPNE
ncbi:MAG: PPOX class F420-dependent oxidoreductase [Rubrobacter sp.]